jgi:hypothetical protein
MRNKFLFVFALFWVALVAYKFLNPATIDGNKFFYHLSEQKIQYIELMPLAASSPIRRSIKIDGGGELQNFLAAWHGLYAFVANHPKDLWSISVRFHTDRGVYSGVLRATTNQGVMFEFDTSPTGWPVASDYQLMPSPTKVAAMLESLKGSLEESGRETR